MKKISNIYIYIKNFILVLIGLLLFYNVVLANETLALGGVSYGRAPAYPLLRKVSRDPGFFRSVGGIAFESIAKGKNGIAVYDMKYNKNSEDGSRLIVIIDTKDGEIEVSTSIYDWELIPISNYTNSKKPESAVTLFGKLRCEGNSKKADEIIKSGGRIINYHPAFYNTLVGLRLFQADILIFQPNSADLFKYNGRYILGTGENEPNVSGNKKNFIKMKEWLDDQKMKYVSYVVGDLDQDVSFEITDDKKLKFSGKPYWFMWKNKNNDAVQKLYKLYAAYKTYEELRKKDKLDLKENITFFQVEKIISEDVKSGGDYCSDELMRMIYKSPVVTLTEFSKLVSDKIDSLNGINPDVFNLLEKVMHYSALFRHFKNNYPSKYNKFLLSIKNVDILPRVETPTIQYPILRSNIIMYTLSFAVFFFLLFYFKIPSKLIPLIKS